MEKKKRCTCQYNQAVKYLDKRGVVHNRNCPLRQKQDVYPEK